MRSFGGVTVGNSWLYNNPDLVYPDSHEYMSEEELLQAVKNSDDKNQMDELKCCVMV